MTQTISQHISGIRGVAPVPGDKSISHRALILASQVLGTTTIRGLLEGEDVVATANALRCMGVDIRQSDDTWVVQGVGIGGLSQPDNILDCGNSGTSARLLMGLVASYPFTSFFTGDASLRKRPMGRVIRPLAQMGAEFVGNPLTRALPADADPGAKHTSISLPLALNGSASIVPIHYELPVASAQVKSAILLAALNTSGQTTVVEPTATRDHTEKMLRHFGVDIGVDGHVITLEGKQAQRYQDQEFAVPSDPSSAAFLTVAALITNDSEVTIPNVCMNPHRIGLYITLQEMGAKLEFVNQRQVAGEAVADIVVASSSLKGIEIPAARAPSMIDEYPILAVAAAFAEGSTVMQGLKELRVKESNRFDAIVNGLKACGVSVAANNDNITVAGDQRVRGGGRIATNLDHRICMSFLVLGMASEQPVVIDSAEPINTSFPGFTDLCNMLGGRIHAERRKQPRRLVIAVDGQAASGKGTLARRLAKTYGLQYLDTGSLYRAVGWKLLQAGHAAENQQQAIAAAKSVQIEDLSSPKLRQEEVGNAASIVSAYPQVRAALLDFQREVAKHSNGAVLDGRDIGTVVCPNADVKFFLTANMDARAQRRHQELSGQGIEVVYQSVYDDLKERDARDAKRDVAPMKPAENAVCIDTSEMTVDSVFEKARAVIADKKVHEVT